MECMADKVVVYHHGSSASGGHYTVSVSRQDQSGWLHFDDDLVTPLPVEDVVVSRHEAEAGWAGQIGGREKTAYLLFYMRTRAGP
jgi:ubiquitin carboxyl-terminal hydrolase 10